MSQPTAYTPVHPFVADSATVPNFPGQALDVEFNAVKATTDQIRTNLALIQRDDGAPANGSVTYDTLSTALQTNGLATASAWLTATPYTVGTTVYQNFILYRCLVSHTSTVFATDLAAGKWLLLVALPANTTLTGPITATNSVTAIASQTGTGTKFVVDTAPTLITPVLGVATATSINNVAITAPAASATLTIPDGVTLTGPAASGTAMTLGNTETVTGIKTFGSAGTVGRFKIAGTTSGSTIVDATAVASGTLTLPAATDTLVGKATTDVLTNKTFDTAAIGNSFSINGVAASANTGTGAVARAAGPTFTTPTLGVAAGTSLALGGGTIGVNDLATGGSALFGNNVTLSKNQNATTLFTVSNTDTTNTSSRAEFDLTGGTVGARFLAISGNSFIIGTTTNHPISFQANGASSMTLDANSGVFAGAIGTSIPVTKTGASSSMGNAESSIIVNNAGTHTLTLLAAASNTGRWLTIKTVTANTVVSASSNVVPRITAAAGTAILPATAGAWVSMQSDGVNWIIMAGTP